jgi:hypothetical protein
MTNAIGILQETSESQMAVANRRVSERFAADGRVCCHPAGGRPGEQWVGKLRDISRAGIGISLPRRWERGTVLILELEPRGDSAPRSLCASLIHATALGQGDFVIGCAHGGDLTDEELQAYQSSCEVEETQAE